MIINNMDIYSFIADVRSYANTIAKSESAKAPHLTDVDKKRFLSFPDALEAKVDRIQAHPHIDTPSFSPHTYDVGDFFDYKDARDDEAEIVNTNLIDMLNLYQALEQDVLKSWSAKISNRFIPEDATRVRTILQKAKMIITDYAAVVGDVDSPEKMKKSKSK